MPSKTQITFKEITTIWKHFLCSTNFKNQTNNNSTVYTLFFWILLYIFQIKEKRVLHVNSYMLENLKFLILGFARQTQYNFSM